MVPLRWHSLIFGGVLGPPPGPREDLPRISAAGLLGIYHLSYIIDAFIVFWDTEKPIKSQLGSFCEKKCWHVFWGQRFQLHVPLIYQGCKPTMPSRTLNVKLSTDSLHLEQYSNIFNFQILLQTTPGLLQMGWPGILNGSHTCGSSLFWSWLVWWSLDYGRCLEVNGRYLEVCWSFFLKVFWRH